MWTLQVFQNQLNLLLVPDVRVAEHVDQVVLAVHDPRPRPVAVVCPVDREGQIVTRNQDAILGPIASAKRGCDWERPDSIALIMDFDLIVQDRRKEFKRTGDLCHGGRPQVSTNLSSFGVIGTPK